GLMGATTDGSFIMARAKAIIRFFIGIVTFPFLIFDLPALIRKRTFKEVISASAILHRFNFLKFIGAVIFIPALIFASIACYILVDQTIIEGPTFMRDLTTRSAPTEEALQ